MQEHAFTVTQLQSISECHEFLLLIILRVFVVDSGYVKKKTQENNITRFSVLQCTIQNVCTPEN